MKPRAKMNETQKLVRYGEIVGRHESESRPGKFYEVRCSPAGEVTCNCRGWATHRKCWHLDSSENAISLKLVAIAKTKTTAA